MKKVDEATGMTIEVPGDAPAVGKFPYPGFWAGAYQGLVRAIQDYALPNESTAAISGALGSLINLANGEHGVILADRLWYIGELMESNPYLSIEGSSGGPVGYVPPTRDGGRMAVAAAVFSVPVKALLQQSAVEVRSGASYSNAVAESQALDRQLEALTIQLRKIEQSVMSRSDLEASLKTGEALSASIQALRLEQAQRLGRLEEAKAFAAHYAQTKMEYDSEALQVKQLQNQIQGTSDPSRRQQLSRQLAPIMQRAQNKSVWLSKAAVSADNATIRDQERLYANLGRDLAAMEADYRKWYDGHTASVAAYDKAVAEGRVIWEQMNTVTKSLEKMKESIGKAQQAMNNVSNIEASQLTMVWVDHLRAVRSDVERLLFTAKAKQMGALQGSPKPILAEQFVDPDDLVDYNEYMDALSMIGDALTSTEYDLVDQIGRLGLSMSYVPGAGRIMALKDLSQRQRTQAYRNLVEEILSQGQKLGEDEREFTLKAAGLSLFTLRNSDDLKEVKELVQHLADSKLNLKYGGGV